MSLKSSLNPQSETHIKPVVGFPGYTVSKAGEVYSKSGKPLAPFGDGRGYLAVGLYCDGKKCTLKIHNIVMASFEGPKPDGFSVEHKDGDTRHNAYHNLEYILMTENYARALQGGKLAIKLNPMKVYRLRRLKENGQSIAYIAEVIGCSRASVRDVLNGKTWKWLK